MALLIKGITKLSELAIDADKVWVDVGAVPHGITSIKQVADLMARGDLVVRDSSVLARIQAGQDGYVLTSTGPGKIPVWGPPGTHLNYFFPEVISLSHVEAIVPVDRTYDKNPATIFTEHDEAYVDAPADNIKRLDAAVALSKTNVVVSVDRTYDKNPATIGRDISIAIDGAVSETWAGVQTNETAAAKSAALNDMNLNPMTPHVDDLYYFGFARVFPRMWFNLSTPGIGNWTNQYEYWNGAAWVAVVDEYDQSSEFQASAGWKRIQWTPQGDWALTVILGMNLYWVRSHTVNYVNQATKPLGAQVFCCLVT